MSSAVVLYFSSASLSLGVLATISIIFYFRPTMKDICAALKLKYTVHFFNEVKRLSDIFISLCF